MATALYRRYRPESFAEVIGQDHVTEPIRRALKSGRIGHAYLFSGPRGCGKTTSARILARCLNCAEGPTDTPCGTCDSCRDLARDGAGSLDVVEIDAASHGGVDDARDLRERAAFAPVRDRFKVFIIDEAHMVTSAGFNALLKLVEEPPEHVKFVFATTEPDKVIGTIRSRTHHYPFRLIPPQVLLPYLEEICAQEGVAVEDGVLSLAVRAGGGSARDTLSVLDQLIAGSDERGVELEVATNLLGFTDVELLNRAVEAIAEHDAATLFGVLDEVIGSGHEPRRFVEDLLERFRDLIVLVAAPERARDLLPDVPLDQLDRLSTQAERFEPRTLTDLAQIVSEALNSMVGATSPRLHLELLAARLILGSSAGSGAAMGGAHTNASGTGGSARGGAPGGASQSDASRQTLSPRQRAVQVAREQAAAAAGRDSDRESQSPQAEETASAQPQSQSAQPQSQSAQPQSQSPQPQPQSPQPQSQLEKPQPRREAASSNDDSWGDLVASQPSDSLKPAPATAPPAPSAQSAPTPQAASAKSGASVSDVEGHWSALMDTLQTLKRASWALIAQNAGLHSFDGSTLVLSFRSQGLVNAFYRGQHAPNMAEAVRRIMRVDVTVEATSGDAPPSGGQSTGGGGRSRGGAPSGGMPNGAPANGGRPSGQPSQGGPAPGASSSSAQSERWGDALNTSAPSRVHEAEAKNAPARGVENSRGGRGALDDAPPFVDDEPPFDEDAPPEDWTPAPEPKAPESPASEIATPENPRGAREMPRGVTEPVRIPAQPGEGEPRTHGQQALERAMRQAFGEGFEPAATLVEEPEANVPAGHEKDPALEKAQAEVEAEHADAWSGSASPAPAGDDGWGLGEATGEKVEPAAEKRELKRGPGLGPAGAPRLTGAALARQALHEAQANRHSGSGRSYGENSSASSAQEAPAAEPQGYDDPFQGASLDDEDASSVGSQRRPGRDIVEEFLGGEVLEVIDEQP
ncbi:DNA polymerase III subunit gamma and tau [Dermabacter vaginalis]|uniref:DNA polymerase III subunit gamma and tau n=1 Tax=Dermabacter vaginalis TaxID=1630135 RepID=UPI001EF55F1A|nr:DNA polymerase III subunit gamma and tau [Dermabacter vaginalis]MCG7443704.1 DNA polymerase III subunit gamma and tau [Dermabacter vaginalis]